MTDTELLNWLEENQGYALVSDDNKSWACVCDGMQTVPFCPYPDDVQTTFFIEKAAWKSSIREAILAAIMQ